MKKFEVSVNEKVFHVTFPDETKFDEKWFEDFRRNFYAFHTLRDVAEHVAVLRYRFGTDVFMEGYGQAAYSGNQTSTVSVLDAAGKVFTKITIKKIFEDDEDVESKEL